MKKWKILETIAIIIALIAVGFAIYGHLYNLDHFYEKGNILIITSLLISVLSQFLKKKTSKE